MIEGTPSSMVTPQVWRGHIANAFRNRAAPTLAEPASAPIETLSQLTSEPPAALIAFLEATNGLYDNDDQYFVFLTDEHIVQETLEVRDFSESFDNLLVIGGPGVDGIKFVMDYGTKSEGVGLYYPIDDEVLEWPAASLWEFVQTWGERAVAF